MEYDLIVVGGGPAGLMAAKTAAESGLKTLLIERKKIATEIRRACAQNVYTRWVCPDAYLEPVAVERGPENTFLHLYGPGISVKHDGPLKVLSNAVFVSPGKCKVFAFKDDIFGYYYQKEAFLAGLERGALDAGVDFMLETVAIGAENTADGVKVHVRKGQSTMTLEARKAFAADGVGSKIVESLGLNENRGLLSHMKGVGYIMEGVTPDMPEHETGYISLHVPGVPGAQDYYGRKRLGLCLWTEGRKFVFGDVNEFAQHSDYAEWFEHAKIVDTQAMSYDVRTPVRDPIVGNIVVVGDAGAPAEVWVQGAVACGYLAAKATVEELNNQPGYARYTAWWQKAFYFNGPGYFKRVMVHHFFDLVCNNEELDYIYKLFEDERVVPTLAMSRNLDLIKNDRPELCEKLKQGIAGVKKQLEPLLAKYPPGSDMLDDPEAYSGPWQSYLVRD